MGEEPATLFRLDFNRSARVEARPERLTSDAGAVLLRSLLDRLGFPALVRRHLHDLREAARVRHDFLELVRTQVLLLAPGWTDQRDANLLRAGAELVSADVGHVMTRQRFRQLVLKAAGRVLISGRRLTLVIEAARAHVWQRFWRELNRRHPARGSPTALALPT